MTNRYRPAPPQEETNHYGPRPLQIESGWCIYARQSDTGQVRDNKESAEMQTIDLFRKAVDMGFQEAKGVLYQEGDGVRGVSGTLRIDQRHDLNAVFQGISNGTYKTVFAYNESRLFRDQWLTQVTTFVEACALNDVQVITMHYRYDFRRNTYDAQQFYFQCQMAAAYIRDHVRGVLVPARLRTARRGEYSGHPVPMGYVVDYTKDSPTEGKYVVYQPHAEIIKHIFKRFRQLDGNCTRLTRELNQSAYVFPAFNGVLRVPPTRCTPILDESGLVEGYSISRYGLTSILTNAVYLGYWIHMGQIMHWNNHEAIVSQEDFWWAFERLSRTDLEGNEVERPHIRQQREHTGHPTAVLSQVIVHPRYQVYAHQAHNSYDVIDAVHGIITKRVACFTVDLLDGTVAQRMLYRIKPLMFGETGILQEVKEEVHDSRRDSLRTIERRLRILRANLNLDPEDTDPGERLA